MFSIGHVSDLHSTPVVVRDRSELSNKRFFGWLSWRLRRRKIHLTAVLEALIDDLASTAPDHIVVTGDLVNISLPSEFPIARQWLERLGTPDEVSVVPGNHDAYVPVPQSTSWDLWSDYISSDDGPAPITPNCETSTDPRDAFPTLRVRGPVAVVGVCSAIPTPSLNATGTLGRPQIERIEALLEQLAGTDLCRMVSIHHPITDHSTAERRSLTDASELRASIRRVGAEIVVHGHNHRTLVTQIPGPNGPIPVVGVRSASDYGHKPHKRAQYHLYDIERIEGPARFRIALRTRGYDPQNQCFVPEGESDLTSRLR
jgi:3',5'-cyclic AMP phosphodiesterase CpdA